MTEQNQDADMAGGDGMTEQNQDADMAGEVTVCVCTYRRPSIATTLESIMAQEGVDTKALRIVVVDNDAEPSARERTAELRAQLGARIDYVHAPARNISVARNAALDAVTTRWAAFIDDDGFASPQWLRHLFLARGHGEAVIGPCEAVYAEDTPGWARACDFHSTRMRSHEDDAYTGNALLDMQFVNRHGLRFLEACGQTGGEDTIFFQTFRTLGGRIRFCPEAQAYEDVQASRATIPWLLRRRFRGGQTHGLKLSMFEPRAYRLLPLTAGAKALISMLACLLTLPVPRLSLRWAARAALHAGAVAFALNGSVVKEYG